ncbi:hypothetical protein BS78_03G252900 [Paspalum vaginatum]|nr:hypothetical protein BS78_03G252900 [Paspalum vaginatum]
MAALRILLLLLALATSCASAPAPSPDAVALLAFKSVCSDRAAALGSWTESSDPCAAKWGGVTCSSSSPLHVRRVVLEGLQLGGHAAALELLADLPVLSSLSLKNNTFTGALHGVDFYRLAPHLKLLYLSGNGFTGRFPESILSLRHLRRLDLSGNRLEGTIPPEIGHRLRALLTLDLARNSFVGPVPDALQAIANLAELNVSGNHLVGRIPNRLAAAFPTSSFAGNPGLCGAPLARPCAGPQQIVYNNGSGEAPDGPRAGRRKKNRDRWMVVMIMSAVGAAVASLLAAALCAVLLLKNRKPTARRPRADSTTSANPTTVAREETVRFDGCCVEFDVATLMQGAAEMLGKGATATTYRVVMGATANDAGDAGVEEAHGEAVVVKRMRRREGASREDERRRRELAREMGTWRHDNVVGLRAFYASTEELLLVFDYIPNGSLHSLLHENRGPARVTLNWQTRLKLAQDAAYGLAYLHGVSGGNLSHGHLTSSNILVDGSGNARVSDFALLQLLAAPAAPGEALQKQDVHGFGTILLEILTGRQSPEDGSASLPQWARTVVREEWTSEVFDVELLRGKGAEDEMVALLQVALLCVADDPRERPRMAVVAKMIEDIRDRGSKRSNKCSASPSQAGHSYESSPCVSEDTTRSTPASSS